MLIVALVPVAIIQWMGLIVAIIGGYTNYSASMIVDHCNIFDSIMREVIIGAARVVYINDGEPGALRSLDRMSTAITHARRETKFRAGEERVESND